MKKRFIVSETYTLTGNKIKSLSSGAKMEIAVKGDINFLNNVQVVYLTDDKGKKCKVETYESVVLFYDGKIAFKTKGLIYLLVTTEKFNTVENFFH